MTASYTARRGQSIYDVCLQTYGSFKYLFKLMKDNNIPNINSSSFDGVVFTFDSLLIQDVSVFDRNNEEEIVYVTKENSTQSYLIQDNGFYVLQANGFKIIIL